MNPNMKKATAVYFSVNSVDKHICHTFYSLVYTLEAYSVLIFKQIIKMERNDA